MNGQLRRTINPSAKRSILRQLSSKCVCIHIYMSVGRLLVSPITGRSLGQSNYLPSTGTHASDDDDDDDALLANASTTLDCCELRELLWVTCAWGSRFKVFFTHLWSCEWQVAYYSFFREEN